MSRPWFERQSWRVGGHWGRTIVVQGHVPSGTAGRRPDDVLIGLVDSAEIAGLIVAAVNYYLAKFEDAV